MDSRSQSPFIDSDGSIKPKLPRRFGKATAAALLSLLFPGLGQIYNQQPRKGLAIAVTFPLLTIGMFESRILLSFWGLVSFLLILIGWRFFIAAEAARVGWKGGKPEARFQRSHIIIPIVVVLVLLIDVFPTAKQYRHRYSYLGAFRVPSGSMCPTVCPGERIVADMDAYRTRSPRRGEIVLLKLPTTQALLIKRVIGVAGDTVGAGSNNEVLVDGKPLNSVEVCGTPVLEKNSSEDLPDFPSIRVPEGSFFVVGDNLANSNDSRYPEFGLVSADQLRGKPRFLYWSPGRSRIGCRTR
jgi:signal peptidase I